MPITFRSPGPELSVAVKEARQAGRCYHITTFEVRSTYKLPRAVFESLRSAGLLGYGQGWSVSDPAEEKELRQVVETDDRGRLVAEGYDTVLNPYSRQPYAPQYRTVYVYTVKDECDSSD